MDYSQWTYSKKGIFSRRPDYEDKQVSGEEAQQLFRNMGGYYIRYVTDFDKAVEHDFYCVIKDGSMTMETLPSKTRNMVRRCLKECEVRMIDCEELINGGGILCTSPRPAAMPRAA